MIATALFLGALAITYLTLRPDKGEPTVMREFCRDLVSIWRLWRHRHVECKR